MIIIIMSGENVVAHLHGLGGTPVAHHMDALYCHQKGMEASISPLYSQVWRTHTAIKPVRYVGLHVEILALRYAGTYIAITPVRYFPVRYGGPDGAITPVRCGGPF
jgi:hypothetical protein